MFRIAAAETTPMLALSLAKNAVSSEFLHPSLVFWDPLESP